MRDDEIIKLYFERNETAITETETTYGKYLLKIAYNILADTEDCKECVNDTYLTLWNAIPPSSPASFSAFAAKIVRNLSLDRLEYYKAQKRIPKNVIDSLSDYANVSFPHTDDKEYESYLIGKVINRYLEAASDRKVYIFMSKYFFFMPTAEIAKKLGCSRSSLERELSEIRDELKKALENEGINI